VKKIVLLFCLLGFITGCSKEKLVDSNDIPNFSELESQEKKINIVDLDSNTRPIAVVVNNSAVAVKVQTGLQNAYLVYEIPVEGGLTRLLAIYKDVEDLTIGTIRSARHNFLDYAFESDAILVHYGWSHYAKDDIKSTGINNINGLSDSAFWRENPEKLPSEHTAYTSISKIKNTASQKGYRMTTEDSLIFQYSEQEVLLERQEGFKKAKQLNIPSNDQSNTSYTYDEESKTYKRFVNGNPHIDYKTKKQYTVKNIIIQKINTKVAKDNYYWDLETVGTGEGFYITNGYAIPITWTKESRNAKTSYRYQDGTEVILNDGNTYVQLQSTKQSLKME